MFAQSGRGRFKTRVVVGALLASAAAVLLGGLAGCANARFYAQAVVGQASLLLARRAADAYAANPATPPEVSRKLRLVGRMLRFAESELRLPVAGRYRSFVAVDGAPLWNVVAAGEFSVTALPRCYPVVGCAVYRGYFAKAAADREAARLRALGYDVHVGAVAAYSTLGWFDDPILSSFLRYPEADLANLIFHELAHSVVYVPGDSTFNESFATFVGNTGARLWLRRNGGDEAAYLAALAAARAYRGYLSAWRERLKALYAAPIEDPAKRLLKAAAYAAMQDCYARRREALGAGRYDGAMATPYNNARLALVATYDELVSAFADLYAAAGGDWREFYERVQAWAKAKRPSAVAAVVADVFPSAKTRTIQAPMDCQPEIALPPHSPSTAGPGA